MPIRRRIKWENKFFAQSSTLKTNKKTGFYDLKKRVDNYYVLNKAEYTRTVTVVHILRLNYQHNYNSNRQYQSQGVSNKLMFTQHGETGYDEDESKEDKTPPE